VLIEASTLFESLKTIDRTFQKVVLISTSVLMESYARSARTFPIKALQAVVDSWCKIQVIYPKKMKGDVI